MFENQENALIKIR